MPLKRNGEVITMLITVGIPAYNLEGYIGANLQSVMDQTYKNFEVLVVDDHSTDRTRDVIRKYTDQDSRFREIDLQRHMGVSVARNKTIDEAKGEVIVFIDGDDTLEPQYLEVMAKGMAQPGIHLVNVGSHWGFRGYGSSGRNKFQRISKREIYDSINSFGGQLGGLVWNKAFSMEVIRDNNLRYDESLNLAEDLLFTAEYILATDGFLLYPAPLYNKISRAGSTIHTATRQMRNREYEVRDHISQMGAAAGI